MRTCNYLLASSGPEAFSELHTARREGIYTPESGSENDVKWKGNLFPHPWGETTLKHILLDSKRLARPSCLEG